MKKSIIILTLLLSACANLSGPKEKPLLYAANLHGDHAALAHCVVNMLHADSRWFMRILHYKFWIYPDVESSEIYAYDTRFLPGIYPSNSPTNPDAVLDYVDPYPEIVPYAHKPADTGAEKFVFTLKQTDEMATHATLKGDKFLGGITWDFLQTCMTFE
jgi:hypothetical protein